jgi:hypothetical protein
VEWHIFYTGTYLGISHNACTCPGYIHVCPYTIWAK